MCSSALRQLGIKEVEWRRHFYSIPKRHLVFKDQFIIQVYFGCGNERFGGNGSVLSAHNSPHPCHPPYEAVQGYLRDESIMILRRFYLAENKNGVYSFFFSGACRPSSITDRVVCVVAPTPRSKANRVLKTAIPPVNMKSLPGSVKELEILVQGTKAQNVQAEPRSIFTC